MLTREEREMIGSLLASGRNLSEIGRALGRDRSVVSREVRRNACMRGYSCVAADRMAGVRRRRGGPRKLKPGTKAFRTMALRITEGWTPAMISVREGLASPETIYATLHALPPGPERRSLLMCLPEKRLSRGRRAARRKPRAIEGARSISERPAVASARAEPGHWESDLIIGSEGSCVGVLAERMTRFVRLIRLGNRTANAAADGFSRSLSGLDASLLRTMTHDRGSEMAQHRSITDVTGIEVFFTDSHAPWQKPTVERMNRDLRRWLPKGLDLRSFTQEQLDTIADRINDLPRRSLGWKTASEFLAEVLP